MAFVRGPRLGIRRRLFHQRPSPKAAAGEALLGVKQGFAPRAAISAPV